MKLRLLIITCAVIFTLLVPASTGQVTTLVPLPADLQGELNGVPYVIRVPANWNGTLLVYSYGYAEAVPLPLAPSPALENALLAKGFALAVSHAAGGVPIPPFPEAGHNVKERIQNTAALTAAFRDMVGQPKHAIAWGKSMGGLVSIGLIEKFPGLYDGAVPLCPPAVGTPRMYDGKLDIVVAYSVAFEGWNDQWGTPGDLRPDLNFMSEVYPHVLQQLTPDKLWRWEFFRRVNHIPEDPSFYGPPWPAAPEGFRSQVLWLAFAPLPDINRRARGRVADNHNRLYTLSDEDKAYLLNMFGVDAEPLLQKMNALAIYAADSNARNYAEHYYTPTGRITHPVITLHTTHDAAAIPNNESAYLTKVKAKGNEDLLIQAFSQGIPLGGGTMLNTHCTFTPAQYLAGIDAMKYWLDTGIRPDTSIFFTPVGLDLSYSPPQWPQ